MYSVDVGLDGILKFSFLLFLVFHKTFRVARPHKKKRREFRERPVHVWEWQDVFVLNVTFSNKISWSNSIFNFSKRAIEIGKNI